MRYLKHLMICINAKPELHPRKYRYTEEMVKLRDRVHDVVKVLIKHDVKLKTLSVKFANTPFLGTVGVVLDKLL